MSFLKYWLSYLLWHMTERFGAVFLWHSEFGRNMADPLWHSEFGWNMADPLWHSEFGRNMADPLWHSEFGRNMHQADGAAPKHASWRTSHSEPATPDSEPATPDMQWTRHTMNHTYKEPATPDTMNQIHGEPAKPDTHWRVSQVKHRQWSNHITQ